MGQDIVARDKVELHSSCVVLEGQETLPHDGVLLPRGNKQEVSLWLEIRTMLVMALVSNLLG